MFSKIRVAALAALAILVCMVPATASAAAPSPKTGSAVSMHTSVAHGQFCWWASSKKTFTNASQTKVYGSSRLYAHGCGPKRNTVVSANCKHAKHWSCSKVITAVMRVPLHRHEWKVISWASVGHNITSGTAGGTALNNCLVILRGFGEVHPCRIIPHPPSTT